MANLYDRTTCNNRASSCRLLYEVECVVAGGKSCAKDSYANYGSGNKAYKGKQGDNVGKSCCRCWQNGMVVPAGHLQSKAHTDIAVDPVGTRMLAGHANSGKSNRGNNNVGIGKAWPKVRAAQMTHMF